MTTGWWDEIDWYHKCAYLSNCTSLWITLSSYLVVPPPPRSILPTFPLHHLTFLQLVISFFHHLYRDRYPPHCLGTSRYDLSHCFSLFRWSLFKSYRSHMSPCFLSSFYLSKNMSFALCDELWQPGLTCSLLSHATRVKRSCHWFHQIIQKAFESNTASKCKALTVFLLRSVGLVRVIEAIWYKLYTVKYSNWRLNVFIASHFHQVEIF